MECYIWMVKGEMWGHERTVVMYEYQLSKFSESVVLALTCNPQLENLLYFLTFGKMCIKCIWTLKVEHAFSTPVPLHAKIDLKG